MFGRLAAAAGNANDVDKNCRRVTLMCRRNI
jgi:hypothetical protein